jgi:general secretion pathway protein G
MGSLRSMASLSIIATALILAQAPSDTREKEAALRKSLIALREAIDRYTFDQERSPQTLQDVVAKGYISTIPVDPMTGKNSTWRLVMEDSTTSVDPTAPGIFDVHSASNDVGSDGTRYVDW